LGKVVEKIRKLPIRTRFWGSQWGSRGAGRVDRARREGHVTRRRARTAIAFKVHTDADPKARARLDEINNAFIAHGSELESICAAQKEAVVRLVPMALTGSQ